jgi:hypothetical protein
MADDDAKARRTSKAPGGPVKKAAPRKVAAKKAPAPKAAPVVRKAAVKKAPAAKAVTPAKRTAVRKAPATAKAAVKKVAKKAPAVAPPPARDRGSLLAPRKKAAPPLRLAAEQTFDDDWKPTPEPVREDPAARVRAVLRQAALSLEGKDAPPPPARPATPAPAPVAAEPEPEEEDEEDGEVTRVLVAPAVEDDFDDFDADLEDEDFEAEAEADLDEEDLEEDVDEVEEELEVEEDVEDEELDDTADDDGDEWAPPEVLDSESPLMSSSTAPAAAPPPPPLSPPLPFGTPPKHQTAADFTPPPAPSPTRRPEKTTEEKKGGRRLLKVLVALLIIVVVVGVGAYAVAKIRDDGVDYSKLKVGDCFDSSPSNEVRGVKVKPSAEEHNSEIFFLVTHPAGPEDPYPGKDALVQFAADACLGPPLTEYLGVPLEQSKLKDFEIVPQESAWKEGRRVLVCGLDTGGEGTLTGSVKGTRR